ncbi:hypothetical protein HK405_007007, partial [Cladochytrium tenue]
MPSGGHPPPPGAAGAASMVAAVAVTAAAAAVAALLLWRRELRRAHLGKLGAAVSTESMAFDRDALADTLTWDRYSFVVHGRRVLLLSGEFHPWRVPDRERWRDVLAMYKACGLNCVRIYFHWGFHSPAEDVYVFDGNRDMDYLLSLCEELRLFVLAAPGPYICAETQGGGHPTWLVAKRDVRIRHAAGTFSRRFDTEYTRHCQAWLANILPIIARHQITRGDGGGCVIAAQVENENFETFFGWPIGLADDMRLLAQAFRDNGVTVPLFHNDGFEAGSFNARPGARVQGLPAFGLDLYAFDKYVVFAPTSAPLSNVGSAVVDAAKWKPWAPATVESATDRMEETVRGFGGSAARGPIFIAELQGGWFNHYTLKSTFDTIYSYVNSSQGVTALNYYMFYGGTNVGTLGDPDVYTSYDYSACIREFGFISGRARKLRLGLIFARCFADLLAETEAISDEQQTILVEPSNILNRQRECVGLRSAELSFFRNFNRKKEAKYTAQLTTRPTVILNGHLPYKCSFIGLGNYVSVISGLHLLLSTIPIHARTYVGVSSADKLKNEVWIIQNDDLISGEMAFAGRVKCTSSHGLAPNFREVEGANTTIVTFTKTAGWCSLVSLDADAVQSELLLIALAGDDLYTLTASFEEEAWCKAQRLWSLAHLDTATEQRLDMLSDMINSNTPLSLAWGAYSVRHCAMDGYMDIEWMPEDQRVIAIPCGGYLSHGLRSDSAFVPLKESDTLFGFPGLYEYHNQALESGNIFPSPSSPVAIFTPKHTRTTDFENLPWQPLELLDDRPDKDMIDLGFTSGHALYKLVVGSGGPEDVNSSVVVSLNMRHRCVVYASTAAGEGSDTTSTTTIGGHTTYSLQLLRPGAKTGPDPFSQYVDYTVALGPRGRATVFVVVESFGMSRQPFVLDDVRNARGLLGVRARRRRRSSAFLWGRGGDPVALALHVAGVDVRASAVSEPFSITGFPDELQFPAPDGLTGGPAAAAWQPIELASRDTAAAASPASPQRLHAIGGRPTWFSGELAPAPALSALGNRNARLPLRLRLTGPGTAHVRLGGTYIARYYGNGDSPQHDFPVPEALAAPLLLPSSRAGRVALEVLVYPSPFSSAATTGAVDTPDWVGVEVLAWELCGARNAPAEERWSGNLFAGEGGRAFWTVRER